MPSPIVAEVLPDRLHAVVFTHEVTVRGASLPCRTCVSHGLRSQGQREVVLTRVAPPADSLDVGDAEVLNLFAKLFAAAGGAPLADVGALTTFEVPFLGAGGPNAVAWVEAVGFPDVPVDGDALAAIVLHPDEAFVAAKYGPARVLARLGRQAGYHPFPRWWDPSRPSVAHPDDDTASALARVARVALPGGTLAAHERTVVLRLPADAREGLAGVLRGLRDDEPCALLVPPEALTDASLVWAPGQESLAATSASGRRARVGGNFVLFAPGHERDQGAPLEDGFAMRLRAETWRTLRSALRNGRGVILEAGDEANHGLRVEWMRGEQGPAKGDDPGAAVTLARVVFMQPEERVAREVSSRELSRYIAAIGRAVDDHFAGAARAPGCDLLLEVQLDARRRPAVSLGVRPPPLPPAVDGVLTRVEALAAPAVRGPVGLRLTFALHGGSGDDPG